jgi:hypothetical protein
MVGHSHILANYFFINILYLRKTKLFFNEFNYNNKKTKKISEMKLYSSSLPGHLRNLIVLELIKSFGYL